MAVGRLPRSRVSGLLSTPAPSPKTENRLLRAGAGSGKIMPMTCQSGQIPRGGEAEGRTPFCRRGVLRLDSVCQSDRKGVWNG